MNQGKLSDDFHVYELAWTPDFIETLIDDELVLSVPTKDMYNFDSTFKKFENIWKHGHDNAPFDQEFYLIFNVAVGGTNWFKDGKCDKPWINRLSEKGKVGTKGSNHKAGNEFWDNKAQWEPTWQGDDVAM